MRIALNTILFVALAMIALELTELGASFTPSFKECRHAENAQANTHDAEKTFQWSIGVSLKCTGVSLDQNNPLISALATAVIAAFTITLWLTSRGQLRELKRSIDSSEESSQRELRAYPGITGADIQFNGGRINIRLKVKNLTKTPANKFRYAITHEVGAASKTKGFKKPVINRRHKWDMAPGSTSTITDGSEIPAPEKAKVIKGEEMVLFISGCIVYRDIFGVVRGIKFRYRTIPFKTDPLRVMATNGILMEVPQAPSCPEPEAIKYFSN